MMNKDLDESNDKSLGRDRADVDFTTPTDQRCPFAAYERARSEGPVYREPSTGYYIVLDYDLARSVGADNRRFSNNTGLISDRDTRVKEQVGQIFAENGYPDIPTLVSSDPPDHRFHRSLVDKAFTPLRVRTMQAGLTGHVDRFIDRLLSCQAEIEFVSEFAIPLPMAVMVQEVGLPPEDSARFKVWSDALHERVSPTYTDERELELAHIVCEIQRYLADKAEQYRVHPANCMLSDIANAEVDGRQLTMPELVNIGPQLLVAGNGTTTSALASAMLHLARSPDLQKQLCSEPALIPNFIEEVLRLDAPVQGLFRRAKVDVKLGNMEVPAGSIVVVRWGAANRDPNRFENPDVLTLNRPKTPQHLTFGSGPHFCIGNQLVRMELQIAVDHLLRRLRNIRLSRGESGVVRKEHYFLWSITELYIAFDPSDQPSGSSVH
jgi:cytochrome P450